MSIVDRAKNIIMKPAEEWNVIADEPATVGGLFTGYAMILSGLALVSGIVATGLLGIGGEALAATGMSTAFTDTIVRAILGYFVGLGMLYVMALIVNAVSPSFNGKSDLVQSLKLMTYASTPSWLVGAVTPFLAELPFLVVLLSFAAIAYVVYLIYLGIKPALSVPQDKVAGFTVVIVLVYIVMIVIVTAVVLGLLASSLLGGGGMPGA
jgi:Yip1 domain